MKANVITLVVIVVMTVWLAAHVGSVAWTPVKVVGGVMAAAGVVLLIVARLQLGGYSVCRMFPGLRGRTCRLMSPGLLRGLV